MTRIDALNQASDLINDSRDRIYGHPAENFGRIAALWSAVLGVDISREQTALCMIALKMSRLVNCPDHVDSWVDIAGYAALGVEVASA